VRIAGMLHGLVLRSPHAHARIKGVDATEALAFDGVKTVLTFADLPDRANGDQGMRDVLENVMARRKALYEGHPVAAIAAVSLAIARKALKLIKVDYEVLPHVTDVEAAMASDAPVLHEHIFTRGVEPKPNKPSNIAHRHQFGRGDLEKGFGAADVVIERTFRTEAAHQGYIEPHACLADLKADGSGEIWCCTQGHYNVRTTCASLLGLDISRLRVTASEIGGGFGGKTVVFLEPLALALSRKAGRPVKMVMSREEVFRASGPTASSAMRVKIGVTKSGRITAGDAELRFQGGAFPGSLVDMGAMAAFACYDLENVRVVGYDVVCNRPKLAAYRAPSAPIAAFAVESVIEELAGRIGMDPLEFRLKNAAKEGTKAPYGPTYNRIGLLKPPASIRTTRRRLTRTRGAGSPRASGSTSVAILRHPSASIPTAPSRSYTAIRTSAARAHRCP
jgi:CO/xanthine dehydrogenase Mo-binding subunit